ncbi:MAG TPA: hypothetical protein P5293_01370 [Bacteroidales bacterium]|nr:hypothetical protein [Bacteroidales bacterium]
MRLKTYLNENSNLKIHPFEEAGLGKYPYKFLYARREVYVAYPGAPVQPGGSCDYCSTGIYFQFWLESADKKKFKVGSECIMKASRKSATEPVSKEDYLLRKAVMDFKRNQVKDAQKERIRIALDFLDKNQDFREVLNAIPRPGWKGEQSMLDYINWMREHSGLAGKMKITKYIENLVKKNWKSMPKKAIGSKQETGKAPYTQNKKAYKGIPGPYDDKNIPQQLIMGMYERQKRNAIEAVLQDEKFRSFLKTIPHPKGFKNKSYLDFSLWLISNQYLAPKHVTELEDYWEELYKIKIR